MTTPICPSAPRTLLATLAVLVGVVLGSAAAARAHTGLESSDPADGSIVTQPLRVVVLTFSGQVLLREVTVTGPSGASAAGGEATPDGGVVTQPVALTEPGIHTVTYAVTSSDGHLLEGSLTFTYAGPGPSAPTSAGAAAASSSTTAPTSAADIAPSAAAARVPAPEDGGMPEWMVAAVATLLLVSGAVLLAARRRSARR